MKTKNQFGETVEGYNIPVLNEREIRAAAGILFFFTFLSFLLILFKGNFVLIKYVITISAKYLFLVEWRILLNLST